MVEVIIIGDENDEETWRVNDALNAVGVAPSIHQTLFEARWAEEFKFCSCGRPEDVTRWLEGVLIAYDAERKGSWEDENAALLGDGNAVLLFVRYVLDALDLTEHGGSVYGAWLTDKGKKVLSELIAHNAALPE